MRNAQFKVRSREDEPEVNAQLIQEIDVIFARDENGVATEGTGWGEYRIDPEYIMVGITTTDEIMDMVMADPRLELVSKGEGWPEPVIEENDQWDV